MAANSSIVNYAAIGLSIANGLVVPLCRFRLHHLHPRPHRPRRRERHPVTSRIPAALPSFSASPGMWVELHPARVLGVGPGTHTFFLNMQSTGAGSGNDRFRFGYLEANFHPFN